MTEIEELEAQMLVPLSARPIPESVQVCATALAAAEQLCLETASDLATDENTQADLLERLAAVDARIGKIRLDLAAGQLTEEAAGGAAYLATLDRDDLVGMLKAIGVAIAQRQEALQAAENGRVTAAANLAKSEAQAEYELLAAQVGQAEGVLAKAINRLHQLGVQAGSPRINQNWRPTPALLRVIRQVAVAGGYRV